MSRIDKYEPHVGGHRLRLNAAISAADAGKAFGVSLNASGRVVRGGAAVADIVGVIVPDGAMAAGDPIDVLKLGEVEEFTYTAGGAAADGDRVYAAIADGALTTTNTGKLVGRVMPSGSGTTKRLLVQVSWA